MSYYDRLSEPEKRIYNRGLAEGLSLERLSKMLKATRAMERRTIAWVAKQGLCDPCVKRVRELARTW
jgi:hypothetical protein